MLTITLSPKAKPSSSSTAGRIACSAWSFRALFERAARSGSRSDDSASVSEQSQQLQARERCAWTASSVYASSQKHRPNAIAISVADTSQGAPGRGVASNWGSIQAKRRGPKPSMSAFIEASTPCASPTRACGTTCEQSEETIAKPPTEMPSRAIAGYSTQRSAANAYRSCDSTAQKKHLRAMLGSDKHSRTFRIPNDCDTVETRPNTASCAAVWGTLMPNRRRAYTPLFARNPHSAR
mmetsp:Transcript_35382/g.92878  ORF Transcript_35382/g.92878 Transcript_35382/m.92878 type:complete len:238 (+) Transcript_35382:220-933(+)